MPSGRIALEALLLKIIRIQQRIPADFLVRQLNELEETIRKAKGAEAVPSVAVVPPAPKQVERQVEVPKVKLHVELPETSISIDPTPTPQELGVTVKPPIKTTPLEVTPEQAPAIQHAITPSAPIELGARPSPESHAAAAKKQSRYDTILQFAAVELEGSLQKTGIKGF
jgi:DNA polymerase III subunit gamma/tau